MSGYLSKAPIVATNICYFLLCHESPILSKIVKKNCLTRTLFYRYLVKWWPSSILPTIKCLNFPLATPLNREYLENQRHTPKRDAILSNLIWNNCFDLAQMAAILDFTHNAMTKVRSCHTRISDILKNPMVHTKIMLVLLICLKWYQLVLPRTNGGHLGFYSQCNV